MDNVLKRSGGLISRFLIVLFLVEEFLTIIVLPLAVRRGSVRLICLYSVTLNNLSASPGQQRLERLADVCVPLT